MVTAHSLQTGLGGSLRAAYDFIEDNLHGEDLTPADVAQALGISIRQLHMLFAPTGQSFSRYVLSRRLEMARLQLGDTDRAILDIVLACGIKSSSVFYRAFRKAFGMKPSGYRQLLRERALDNSNGSSLGR